MKPPISIDTRDFERAMRTSIPASLRQDADGTIADAASGARTALVAEMKAKLDRPSPSTLAAFVVRRTSPRAEPS